jgi:hypothetical protein
LQQIAKPKDLGGARPRLRVPRGPLTAALDALGLLITAGLAAYAAFTWSALPEMVPSHFDIHGRIDAVGRKELLLVLPAIAIAVYFGFLLLRRIPHHFNYPFAITSANAERQYALACGLLSFLGCVVPACFGYLYVHIAAIAGGGAEPRLDPWFLPVFLTLVFVPIVVFIVRSIRAR